VNGYRVPHGYFVPVSPYAPPYPRLLPTDLTIPYTGVVAVLVLTMTSANLALDPVDNTPIVLALPVDFSGPGGTFHGFQFIADRNGATPAPPAGFLQIVVTVDGAVTTNALLAAAVAAAFSTTKVNFYPGIPINAVAVGDAVHFAWDYPTSLPNGFQAITDSDWSTNETDPAWSGGVEPAAAVPACIGPRRAFLPTIQSTDAYGGS
jgi:hypothetical protein